MVGDLQPALEWGVHLKTDSSEPSERTPVVRCVRLMGMRCHMAVPVAPGGVGSPAYSIRKHRTKGVLSNTGSGCHIGPTVEGMDGMCPL